MSGDQVNSKDLNIDPDILTKAWDGDATAQRVLGEAYFNAVYVEDNTFNAYKWVYRSAKQGNMEAQFILGNFYSLGQGVKQSYADAYYWYTKSAVQGYQKALIRIHNLYQQDIRMQCRGKLNSEEELRKKEGSFSTEEYYYRELYEQRLEDNKKIVNNAINYYKGQFDKCKSSDLEDMEVQLNIAFLYDYGYGFRKNRILAIDFYTKAAEQGHKDAQYNLGYFYENNTDIKFNYKHAIQWYRASATNGNITAQNRLGYLYEKGLATELSYEGVLYWYTKSASAGNSNAQLTLGKLYRKGQGVEKNFSEAIKWYDMAAKQGSKAAQSCLTQLLQNQESNQNMTAKTKLDYINQIPTTVTLSSKLQKDIIDLESSPGIDQLKKTAQHALMSDGGAMYKIGLMYYNGVGFCEDRDTGLRWIKRAAKAGFQEAELKLSCMYEQGDEVEQNYHESSIWASRLSKKKNHIGQLKLGLLYKNGLGVRKDPLEASKWFIKSAEQGNIDACYQYGLLKFEGEGVREDVFEAHDWLLNASRKSNPDALYKLGYMYEVVDYSMFIGRGKEEHSMGKSSVIKMHQVAARLGNRDAQFRLARIYEEGKLIEQDLHTSKEYYIQAATSDDPFYQTELAIRYINGVFYDPDYIKAFDLFNKAAEKMEPRASGIFRTPVQSNYGIKDHSKILDMLVLASERGVEGLEYIIGYIYEYGIQCGSLKIINSISKNARNWYLAAASKGDSRAKYRLGVMHEEGKDNKKSIIQASEFYSQASDDGNNDAMYSLGLMYLYGREFVFRSRKGSKILYWDGLSQDVVTAFHFFKKAFDLGDVQARDILEPSKSSENIEMLETIGNLGYAVVQYKLGKFYEYEDDQKSFGWYTLAAKGGVVDASYRLGILYEKGRGTDCDYLKAIESYEEAIKHNHDSAMYRLAKIYHSDNNPIKCDYLEAYKFYKRAAEHGHDMAIQVLSFTEKLYGKNQGDSLNGGSDEPNKYLSMVKFVANQGDVHLQYQIGVYHENSQKQQNYEEAFKWYKMAADNLHSEAIYRLGLLYEKGLGTDQNYKKSLQLYQKIKDEGNRHVLYHLHLVSHYIKGTDKNSTETRNLCIEAANLGDPGSQYKLGKLYATGELVQKDILKALVWYTKAYLNGSDIVVGDLYNLYDDDPYESFFHRKLFQMLSKFEKSYKNYDDDYREIYGSMYYRLGKMYLDGIGTNPSRTEALVHFSTAYDYYFYPHAEPLVTLNYPRRDLSYKAYYSQKLEDFSNIRNQLSGERQYQLGMLYYKGLKINVTKRGLITETSVETIVEKDYRMAHEFFKLASLDYPTKAKAYVQLALTSLKLRRYIRSREMELTLTDLKLLRSIRSREMAMDMFRESTYYMDSYQCYSYGMQFYKRKKLEDNFEISLIFLQKAAENSSDKAEVQLGLMYLQGKGVEQDIDKATYYFKKSASTMEPYELYNQGMKIYNRATIINRYNISQIYLRQADNRNYTLAQAQLGLMYIQGYVVENNHSTIMQWISQYAKTMTQDEYNKYVLNVQEGIEIDQNYEIVILYLKVAREKGQSNAQAYLGIMYLQGDGFDQDYNKALKWIRQSTEEMKPADCYLLGMKYFEGNEVDTNHEIALLYLKSAADKNYGNAHIQLCLMYLNGDGVERDYKEAIKWFQRSTRGMELYEYYEQGMKFYEGDEVAENYQVALLYLNLAAKNNNEKAQAQLGLMYLKGHGVNQDRDEAEKWFQKSAEEMGANECYEQGMKFYNGDEVDRNYRVALIYLNKAAGKEEGDAQAQLGLMYLKGAGVGRQPAEAEYWFHRSALSMKLFQCYKKGMSFYKGIEVDRNYRIAFLYLNVAAERNLGIAKIQLGLIYLKGHGVQQNDEKALKYMRQSLQGMGSYECYKQGIKFHNGIEVDKNDEIALLFLRAAAELNDSNAQAQLGQMYLNGDGVEKDYDEAVKLIQQSIEKKHQHSFYKEGMKYYNGSKADENYEIALLYLRVAAENNDRDAQAQLCLMHLNGNGVHKSRDEALKWFKRSTFGIYLYEYYEQGMKFYEGTKVPKNYGTALLYFNYAAKNHDVKAQIQLGLMHLKGHGVEKNYSEAIKWLQKSTQGMKPRECYKQGMKFYEGDEVDRNYHAALFYLRAAADKNDGHARTQLGLMYLNGDAVEEDNVKAMEWFHQAIEVLEPCECYSVGMKFFNGSGFPKNYIISLMYLKSAAIGGSIYSQAQLGHTYFRGTGVDENREEASVWYDRITLPNTNRISYELGTVYHSNKDGIQDFSKALEYYQEESNDDYKSYAFRSIGLLYEYGDGVDQDYPKALEYYKKSADNYNKGAYFNLGLLYYYGRGVEKNYASALYWFDKGTQYFLPKHPLYVIVENNTCNSEDANNFENRKYSLQDEYTIYGKMCYYIGLMHQKGFGTGRSYKKARYYFKVALEYGIESTQQLLK